jgi:hypothetical protein
MSRARVSAGAVRVCHRLRPPWSGAARTRSWLQFHRRPSPRRRPPPGPSMPMPVVGEHGLTRTGGNGFVCGKPPRPGLTRTSPARPSHERAHAELAGGGGARWRNRSATRVPQPDWAAETAKRAEAGRLRTGDGDGGGHPSQRTEERRPAATESSEPG